MHSLKLKPLNNIASVDSPDLKHLTHTQMPTFCPHFHPLLSTIFLSLTKSGLPKHAQNIAYWLVPGQSHPVCASEANESSDWKGKSEDHLLDKNVHICTWACKTTCISCGMSRPPAGKAKSCSGMLRMPHGILRVFLQEILVSHHGTQSHECSKHFQFKRDSKYSATNNYHR